MLDWATFTTCIDKVPRGIQIDFSGFCEPWLNPLATRMVEYVTDRGHNVYIYTTLKGMARADAVRVAACKPLLIGIHIRDADDRSPIHDVDLDLAKILHPTEYISHGPPHPEVVPYLLPGVHVSNCRLHSRGGLNWDAGYRKGPLRCSSTRLFRHNVMLPDGRVVLCCTDYGLKHVVGDLTKQSYPSLFEGQEYQRIETGALTEGADILCRQCEIARAL